MRITPERMDIVTRVSYPKDSLLRFLRIDGVLILDKNQDKPGRGIYVSPNSLNDSRIEKCFSRAFRTNITKEMIKEAMNG